MEGRPPKPRLGDLVRIKRDYPNEEAAGMIGLVTKTVGIECIVQPAGKHSQNPLAKPWWLARSDLEVL